MPENRLKIELFKEMEVYSYLKPDLLSHIAHPQPCLQLRVTSGLCLFRSKKRNTLSSANLTLTMPSGSFFKRQFFVFFFPEKKLFAILSSGDKMLRSSSSCAMLEDHVWLTCLEVWCPWHHSLQRPEINIRVCIFNQMSLLVRIE